MKRTKWVAGAALALLVAAPLRADHDLIPLGQLMGRAEAIVIGRVTGSRPTAGAKSLMTVAVEETLKGTPPESVQIFASSVDPTYIQPLSAGVRILAFLEPRTLQPVAGDPGIMVLGGGSAGVAGEIVRTALAKGAGLQLRDVAPYFGSREPLPPGLVASLLEEMSAHVTPTADGTQLAQLACDGSVLPAVQLWAIGRSGRLQIAAGRPCLESLVRDPKDLGTRIAAATALGDLQMAESVPVLLTLIAPLPGQPASEPQGDEDPPVRPASDPEDESSPAADPEEQGSGIAIDDEQPGTPSTLPDGETEPDDVPGDDILSRRADGGLSDAAVLALGKIGDPAAVRDLFRVAGEGDDLALHSTVVVALGLIGGEPAQGPLATISRSHPNELVRELASQTLARLRTNP